MEAQVLNLKRCEYGIQHTANNHRAQRACSIGTFPVETQHQRPEKNGFKAAVQWRDSGQPIPEGAEAQAWLRAHDARRTG